MRRQLERRIAFLTQAKRLILRISEHIRVTAAPIGEVLRRLSETAEFAQFPLLNDTVRHLSADGAFRDAWRTAATAQTAAWRLSDREQRVLLDFADGLGTADIAGEVRHCERFADDLCACIGERREQAVSRGRLYPIMGFCVSSATALLLV